MVAFNPCLIQLQPLPVLQLILPHLCTFTPELKVPLFLRELQPGSFTLLVSVQGLLQRLSTLLFSTIQDLH